MGLSTLVKSCICDRVMLIDSCPPLANAVLISVKPMLILVNIYIPPTSDIESRLLNWEKVSNYIISLKSERPEAKIILMGDFNARIGINCNTLNPFSISTQEMLFIDTKFNYAYKYFSKLCNELELKILNGSSSYPNANKFTHISARGNSVIDYCCVSPELLDLVKDFAIKCHTESDHLPLLLSIQIESITPSFVNDNAPDSALIFKKINWTPSTTSFMEEFLESSKLTALRESLILAESAQLALPILEELMASIYSLAKPVKVIPNITTWFDKDCLAKKKELRLSFKTFLKSSHQMDQDRYAKSKKEYELLVRSKQSNFYNKTWEDLNNALKSSNGRIFWKAVSNALNNTNNSQVHHITAHTWVAHFSKVLSDPYSEEPTNTSTVQSLLPH